MFYELARDPERAERLAERARRGRSAARRRAPHSCSARCPSSTWRVDETLRLYPPAWIGPRRAIEDFEFAGHRVPAGAPGQLLVLGQPPPPRRVRRPARLQARALRARGEGEASEGRLHPLRRRARICIGMRFGELEVRAIAAAILGRFRLGLEPDWRMRVRQMPTLSPRGGLPMRVL